MSARSRPRIAADTVPEQQSEGRALADTPASELSSEATVWLWRDRLEEGTTALLQGEKGAGKSTWLRLLAAAVSTGGRLPGERGRSKRKPAGVLWYAGEESLKRRVRPGLEAAGADLSRVYCADCYAAEPELQLALPNDADRLISRIRARSARLVVLDPVWPFSDGTCDLEGPTMPARTFMRVLGQIAQDTASVLLMSRNLTKDTTRGALAAGRGCAEIGHAARSVLHLSSVPGETGVYGLAVAACNAGRPAPTLSYRLAAPAGYPVIELVGEVALSADDLLGGDDADLDRALIERAKELLLTLLAGGRVLSTTVRAQAKGALITERTIQRAGRSLGVVHHREGTRENTRVYWSLPRKRG